MSRRKSQLFLTFFLVLLIFGLGSRIVNAAEEKEGPGTEQEKAVENEENENSKEDVLTEEDADVIQKETEKALMDRFDFEEIESSLEEMFPKEKISFRKWFLP